MKLQDNTTAQSIVVLGANGGIGREVVKQALAEGHYVTAILRTPKKLTITHENLKVIQGNILDPKSLLEAFEGNDIVVSAIGNNSIKKTTLFSEGSKNVIEAIEFIGINRAFFISASGIDVNPTHSWIVRFATKYILQTILRNVYADQVLMENLIKKSRIDWTIVRPPKLLDKPKTGLYRVSTQGFLNNGLSISRADVAHFILNNLDNSNTVHKTVEIAY
ncbi:SDR family oxidoreductase [Mucilaginibacter sp. cycad4]|uniref:NAD(P)-dependent oxidoreductase n=1 Tax=Mucilaginibacter sp. cycad4 TaxID=3342096 RepID=UPI002AAAB3DA|nr:SDR family oxidoreductase [Mucilaginibacter gossypii]WPU97810.1 SDR family oxidoreductase [Mucilaginibacter gossypii]